MASTSVRDETVNYYVTCCNIFHSRKEKIKRNLKTFNITNSTCLLVTGIFSDSYKKHVDRHL